MPGVVSREEDVEIVCMELMLIMEKCGKNADRGKDFISVKPA